MVSFPPAQQVSPTRLILLQSLLPTVDLLLLRTFPHSGTLRGCLLGYHSLIPLLVTTNQPAINLFLVPTPIFLCAQNLSLPTPLPPVKDIVKTMCSTMLEPNPPADSTKVRQRAVLKLARGALKYAIKTALLVPLLQSSQELADMSWYSPISIANTLGYGAVLYCVVGMVTDVGTGLAQLIVNRDLMELMNKPFLAYSPRNFWSKRWNRIASDLFHRTVFIPNNARRRHSVDKVPNRRWNTSVAALSAFTVSGIFHELLVVSLFRETGGENLAFFLLQGLASVAEVQYLGSRYTPQGIRRVLSTSATFVWLGVTGRLFFLPYWRRNFFSL